MKALFSIQKFINKIALLIAFSVITLGLTGKKAVLLSLL
jgi:hypothetical protein